MQVNPFLLAGMPRSFPERTQVTHAANLPVANANNTNSNARQGNWLEALHNVGLDINGAEEDAFAFANEPEMPASVFLGASTNPSSPEALNLNQLEATLQGLPPDKAVEALLTGANLMPDQKNKAVAVDTSNLVFVKDIDGDKKLSRGDIELTPAQLDTDGNGKITDTEIQAANAMQVTRDQLAQQMMQSMQDDMSASGTDEALPSLQDSLEQESNEQGQGVKQNTFSPLSFMASSNRENNDGLNASFLTGRRSIPKLLAIGTRPTPPAEPLPNPMSGAAKKMEAAQSPEAQRELAIQVRQGSAE